MAITIPQTRFRQAPAPLRNSIMGVRILACGSYVPDKVVTNADLAGLGCDEQWIVQRTGILERRHASPRQATSDLALEAARRCLEKANVSASEIDLIIVATMTPDHYTPSASALLQSRLCCTAAAMDLNAACSGFMYGMITASQFIRNGCSRMALVVGADVMSRVIDPLDSKTYPLFGDGAGAALLAPAEGPDAKSKGILAYRLASEGELGYLIAVPAGGSRQPATQEVLEMRHQYLQMNGKPVFKWAVRIIPRAVQEVLESASLTMDDIDVFLFHQANRRIIDAAAEYLNVPPHKLFVNLQNYGNTSAASIPLSWDEAAQQGLIQPNSRVLMCGFGAGLTWGACIYQG